MILKPEQRRAIAVFFCVFAHALTHGADHSIAELLWVCNVGSLLIAVGLWTNDRMSFGVGTLWLTAGTPLWLLDLLARRGFLWTSLLTHVVVLSIAFLHAKKVGLAQSSWWMALLGGGLLQQLSRWFTHWRFNVNMAWGVYPGVRRFFHQYTSYWLCTFVLMGISFWALQWAINRAAKHDASTD